MTTIQREAGPGGVLVMTLTDATGEVRASITEAGGELCSLQRRWRGRSLELIYRADRVSPARAGWRGGAPWLFPAVGRSFAAAQLDQLKAQDSTTKDGTWTHAGATFPMPCHGFVMERRWELASGPETVIAKTVSDASTRAFYPFDYELSVEYSLLPAGVNAKVRVTAGAGNDGPMPFSIGNHVTLAIPFTTVGNPRACRVATAATEDRRLSRQSLLSGEVSPIDFSQGMPIQDAPALSNGVIGGFTGADASAAVIDSKGFGVRVSQREVARGPLKTKPEHRFFVFYCDGQNFICPEPWYGAPNSLNDRSGVVQLAPGEAFEWEMAVEAV
jgi:galactose mutarotase-like enzyme